MRPTPVLLLVMLMLLSACRYTFWPLIPPEETYPERISITGALDPAGDVARVALDLRRWPEPNYLELKWLAGDHMVEERSLWVERPRKLELTFPYEEGRFYRLLVIVEGRLLLQLDLGAPSLPPPPAPPGQGPAAGSEN